MCSFRCSCVMAGVGNPPSLNVSLSVEIFSCPKIFFQKYKIWGWKSPFWENLWAKSKFWAAAAKICSILSKKLRLPAPTFLTHDATETMHSYILIILQWQLRYTLHCQFSLISDRRQSAANSIHLYIQWALFDKLIWRLQNYNLSFTPKSWYGINYCKCVHINSHGFLRDANIRSSKNMRCSHSSFSHLDDSCPIQIRPSLFSSSYKL